MLKRHPQNGLWPKATANLTDPNLPKRQQNKGRAGSKEKNLFTMPFWQFVRQCRIHAIELGRRRLDVVASLETDILVALTLKLPAKIGPLLHRGLVKLRSMRFTLIDKVVELESGKRIEAIKNLSLAEEYLADHFPGFPVMPGVFMLEAMTQASAWLIRASEDFAHGMVTLKEARNVKYASFVEPGQTLRVTAEILGQDERETKLKAQGTVGDVQVVSARLVLERYNLADQDPAQAVTDQVLKYKLRELFALLYRAPVAAT